MATTTKYSVRYVVLSPRRSIEYQRSTGLEHATLKQAEDEAQRLIAAEPMMLHVDIDSGASS